MAFDRKAYMREYNKKWAAANRDKKNANQKRAYRNSAGRITRNSYLKRRFGLTLEQYAAMLTAQSGRCAACGEPSTKTLHVDHCHESGLVRGLLCHACNTALGLLRECPKRMDALKAYISNWNWLK